MKLLFVFALALSGCLATAQRSRDVLGNDRSQAEIPALPYEAGRALVRLFASRGFALLDQRTTPGGLVLRFKGRRESATEGGKVPSIQFGSLFTVTIDQTPDGHALVTIDGAPFVDDDESCVPEQREPCDSVLVSFELSSHIDGRAEADVVRGVFAELALEGLLVDRALRSPASLQAQELTARARCEAIRHRMLVEAYQTDNEREKNRLIAAAPSCLSSRSSR